MKITRYATAVIFALAGLGTAFAQTGDPAIIKPVPPGWEMSAPALSKAQSDALARAGVRSAYGEVQSLLGDYYSGGDIDSQIAALMRRVEDAKAVYDEAFASRDDLAKSGKATAREIAAAEARVTQTERAWNGSAQTLPNASTHRAATKKGGCQVRQRHGEASRRSVEKKRPAWSSPWTATFPPTPA